MSNTTREHLRQLLINQSVKRGSFTLASGRKSSIYVDARLTTMHPVGMHLIGTLAIELLRSRGWKPDSVGGLTLGADPVSFAISYTSGLSGSPIRAFTVRKESKAHGTGNLIEGPFRSSDQVVIVEDVITTGKSAMQAMSAVSATGARIIGVLAIVDREEGGRAWLEAEGQEVASFFRISELHDGLPVPGDVPG